MGKGREAEKGAVGFSMHLCSWALLLGVLVALVESRGDIGSSTSLVHSLEPANDAGRSGNEGRPEHPQLSIALRDILFGEASGAELKGSKGSIPPKGKAVKAVSKVSKAMAKVKATANVLRRVDRTAQSINTSQRKSLSRVRHSENSKVKSMQKARLKKARQVFRKVSAAATAASKTAELAKVRAKQLLRKVSLTKQVAITRMRQVRRTRKELQNEKAKLATAVKRANVAAANTVRNVVARLTGNAPVGSHTGSASGSSTAKSRPRMVHIPEVAEILAHYRQHETHVGSEPRA